MSVEATRAVWRFSQSTGTARLVLLAIADNADEGGLAWPGHETLAEKCKVSRRTVIDNIDRLERLQELSGVHRRNAGNIYLIDLGDLPEIHRKHHQQARYKCRFCTLLHVHPSAGYVHIPAGYVQPSVGNVKTAAHEPSEPSETFLTANASQKINPNCPECGTKSYDCLRCVEYGNRESRIA